MVPCIRSIEHCHIRCCTCYASCQPSVNHSKHSIWTCSRCKKIEQNYLTEHSGRMFCVEKFSLWWYLQWSSKSFISSLSTGWLLHYFVRALLAIDAIVSVLAKHHVIMSSTTVRLTICKSTGGKQLSCMIWRKVLPKHFCMEKTSICVRQWHQATHNPQSDTYMPIVSFVCYIGLF